jgi:cathepsin B
MSGDDKNTSSTSNGTKGLRALISEHPMNTVLRGDTKAAERKFANLIPEPSENIYKFVNIPDTFSVPDSFEGKEVWKKYLSDVQHQRECGSCWAFAAVSTLADRFNLFSRGQLHLNLSPVPIVLCDTHGAYNPEPLNDLETSLKVFESVQKLYGCNGNLLSEAWRMLYTVGTNEQSCMPLNILKFQSPSSCIKLTGPAGDMCSDYLFNFRSNTEYGTPAKFYTAYHVYAVPGTPAEGNHSELNIRREIYKFGPVSTAFEVYSDFYTFDPKTTIYRSKEPGTRIAGHAVVLDGWGEENGVKFWWVRNTWGPDWGINGYFRIVRGENHCKIEENVIAGIPDLSSTHFVIPEDIFQRAEIPRDVKSKFSTHSYNNMAGGIDPNTGYSRRIMSYLENREDIRPIIQAQSKIPVPNYTQFVAADVNASVPAIQAAAALTSNSASFPTASSSDNSVHKWILGLTMVSTLIGIYFFLCWWASMTTSI